MNNADQLRMLLPMFTIQLPTLFVCLVACVVIVARWNEASKAALWALLGFGLTAILCLAIPATQTGVQQWMAQSGATVAQRSSVFAGLGFFWSVLRAFTYALLLIAVFAGRSTRSSAPTPL